MVTGPAKALHRLVVDAQSHGTNVPSTPTNCPLTIIQMDNNNKVDTAPGCFDWHKVLRGSMGRALLVAGGAAACADGSSNKRAHLPP